jgi:hypothetical protein
VKRKRPVPEVYPDSTGSGGEDGEGEWEEEEETTQLLESRGRRRSRPRKQKRRHNPLNVVSGLRRVDEAKAGISCEGIPGTVVHSDIPEHFINMSPSTATNLKQTAPERSGYGDMDPAFTATAVYRNSSQQLSLTITDGSPLGKLPPSHLAQELGIANSESGFCNPSVVGSDKARDRSTTFLNHSVGKWYAVLLSFYFLTHM